MVHSAQLEVRVGERTLKRLRGLCPGNVNDWEDGLFGRGSRKTSKEELLSNAYRS